MYVSVSCVWAQEETKNLTQKLKILHLVLTHCCQKMSITGCGPESKYLQNGIIIMQIDP